MQQKDEHLHIRASEHEKSTIAHAAMLRNMSVTQFILRTAVPVAEEIVRSDAAADQALFRLQPDEWAEFLRLLDAPTREIPELRKLLAERAPWEA